LQVEDITQRLEDKEGELKTLQNEHKDMKLEKSKVIHCFVSTIPFNAWFVCCSTSCCVFEMIYKV
jgi:hypothetical protein